MGHSWTIDLDAEPTPAPHIPPGSVLVADVYSRAESTGPRKLVAFSDGTSVAVRKSTGDLMWLDTPSVYAFVNPVTGIVEAVSQATGDGLIPPDCGAEALAMLSLFNTLDWSNAVATSSVHAERVRLMSENWGALIATIEPVVPVVRRLELAGSSADPLLTTEQFGFLPRNERWFAPSHIVIGPWPHDAESHR
jgi:hypothetical protein